MEEISQELLLERCGAVLRELAQETPRTTQQTRIWNEVRAIVAILPEPKDPDVVEARALCADDTPDIKLRARYMAGELDHTPLVTMALAGIRRGRELAKARAGEGSGE